MVSLFTGIAYANSMPLVRLKGCRENAGGYREYASLGIVD